MAEGVTVDAGLTRAKEDVPLRPSNFFAHHDTHPLVLDAVLVNAFGPEWWEWDGYTLWVTIQDHFAPKLTNRGVALDLSELNKNKIQAVKVLHGSEGFWKAWDMFAPVIQALNNNIPRFDVVQQPTMAQLLAGVDVAMNISDREFSEEVARFVAAACLADGVWYLPDPLEFAQRYAERRMYRCKDCGNEDEDDLEDGTCDQCAHRFKGTRNLNGKIDPNSPAARLGEGKNLEHFVLNDPAPVRKRYEEVVGNPRDHVDLKETQVDVCVAKVLVAVGYMRLRRRQLSEQMEVMHSWLRER